jgi:lysophospholipase L1-like esterase
MPEHESGRQRLFRSLTIGEGSRTLGWAAIVVSVLLLSAPVASVLFSVDDRGLRPEVAQALEWGRLVLGAVGLVLAALGRRRVGFAARQIPLRLGDAVLLIATGILALAAVEGYLRLRGAREWGSATRMPLPMRSMRRDPELVLRPGRYGQPVISDFDPGYRRFAVFSINRLGLRGPSASSRKAAGTRRVICLGGSTTFGYAVGDGEDWPAQLQKELGSGVEVLNAGRPGSTTFRDFGYLRDRLLRLEPDVVVLYEGFNDMWRGVRSHAGEQSDYGVVAEGLPAGEEPLDLSAPRDWPPRASFLAYYMGRWLEGRVERQAPDPAASLRVRGPFRFEPAVVTMYEHNLRAIIRLCHRQDVRILVLTFAGCDDPSRTAAEQRQRLRYVLKQIPPLDPQTAMEGMSLYRQKTRQVAEEESVPLFDAAAVMTKDLGAYTDTVHFTPRGEHDLAYHVAGALRAKGLIPPADVAR